MSEAEKQRRLLYKLNRQKWIQILAIVLAAIVLIGILCSVLFYHFNKAYYISYAQQSDVDYRVLLKENSFYEGQYAEEGKAYIADLIDKVNVLFAYDVLMDTKDVNFEYSYRIEALMQIKDNNGAVIYDHTDVLLPATEKKASGDELSVREEIWVDYGKYNDLATRFMSLYLKETNSKSSLSLRMFIEVIGACEDFSDQNNDAYVITLDVPLSSEVVNMSISSTVEEGNNQILACENETVKNVFMILTIVFAGLAVVAAGLFVAFILLTRSTDINYEIKRNRILQTYKPFIQKITNAFRTEGYQVISVEDFKGMLEIRDTIQSPILMYENDDKTLTAFYIPTNTDLLYMYELRIEDYDLIYGATEEDEDDRLLYVESAPTASGAQIRTSTKRKMAIRSATLAVFAILGGAVKASEASKKEQKEQEKKKQKAKATVKDTQQA